MRYCGRDFSEAELDQIRTLIAQHPELSRRELSRRVCRALGWLKPDGSLKDMSCRVALLRLDRAGVITLPELAAPPPQNFRRHRPVTLTAASEPGVPLTAPVHELPALEMTLVRRAADSRLWNEYIARYHYLGYTPLPGAQLRYSVRIAGQVVALLGFGAAAWKTAPRDQFIGWDAERRERALHLVVNNARFLILPWVSSKGLASKILSRIARRLPQDWAEVYGYRPVLLETFVQAERFRGTCYQAANWIHVGKTQGRGKLDRYNKYALPVKDIWLYPLHKKFRQILTQGHTLSAPPAA